MRLITNPLLMRKVLIRNPRSKKKRIIKKWNKNQKNYKLIPDDNFYVMANGFVCCHPIMKEKLMQSMKERK